MPTIVKRNGSYVPPHDEDYLPAAGYKIAECKTHCKRLPHYRCTRSKSHPGDHAAHGNLGDVGLDSNKEPMYARWPRVGGKEGKVEEVVEE